MAAHQGLGSSQTEQTRLQPKEILIVEDDAQIREALGQILEYEGYKVTAAVNGQDALVKLEQGAKPSLILLDLMMPVMSGTEFIEKQRENPSISPIPVVVLSAAGNLNRTTATLNVAACLKKPVELDSLLDAVKRYLS